MGEKNKIDETIENVTGGVESEEFDWESKGFITPEKEDDNTGWHFKPIGDLFNKIFNKNK